MVRDAWCEEQGAVVFGVFGVVRCLCHVMMCMCLVVFDVWCGLCTVWPVWCGVTWGACGE